MPPRAFELNSFIGLVGRHFDLNHVAVAQVVLVAEFDFACDFEDVLRVALGGVGAEDDGALVEDAAGDYVDGGGRPRWAVAASSVLKHSRGGWRLPRALTCSRCRSGRRPRSARRCC